MFCNIVLSDKRVFISNRRESQSGSIPNSGVRPGGRPYTQAYVSQTVVSLTSVSLTSVSLTSVSLNRQPLGCLTSPRRQSGGSAGSECYPCERL